MLRKRDIDGSRADFMRLASGVDIPHESSISRSSGKCMQNEYYAMIAYVDAISAPLFVFLQNGRVSETAVWLSF